MLNGDVLTDIDLTAQLRQHEETGAMATLALYPVEDPSAYGLVRLAGDNQVTEFVEKPSADQIDTNNISAGAYVLERSVLDLLVAGEPASIERDVFPRLVGDGLYGFVGGGYWMDIGTPERYLQGTFDILEGSVGTEVAARMGEHYLCVERRRLERRADRPLGADRVRLHDRRRARGSAAAWCSSAASTIGAGSTVQSAVVLEGATVGERCVLSGCIVGARRARSATTATSTG